MRSQRSAQQDIDVVAAALAARCTLARARVVLAFDEELALGLAGDALEQAAYVAFNCPSSGVPWPLRAEPALSWAYTQGAELSEELRGARAADARERTRRIDDQQARRRATAVARHLLEQVTPSAEQMLQALRASEWLEMNGHSLMWDASFDLLTGTNAYGVDYYFGPMNLEAVARWRRQMLDGDDLGPTPEDGFKVEIPHQAPYDNHERLVLARFDDLIDRAACCWNSELQYLNFDAERT